MHMVRQGRITEAMSKGRPAEVEGLIANCAVLRSGHKHGLYLSEACDAFARGSWSFDPKLHDGCNVAFVVSNIDGDEEGEDTWHNGYDRRWKAGVASAIFLSSGNADNVDDIVLVDPKPEVLSMVEELVENDLAMLVVDFSGKVDNRIRPVLDAGWFGKAEDEFGELYLSYSGPIPDRFVEGYGRQLLKEALCEDVFIKAFGAYERFDVPNGIDPLEILSMGREHMPDEMDISRESSFWERNSLLSYVLGPIDEDVLEKCAENTDDAVLARKLSDLAWIWKTCEDRAGMGLRIPSAADDTAHQKFPPLCRIGANKLEAAAAKVAETLDVSSQISAYYSGVPLEDIVA
ncbi:MAG: hypothetical protein BZ138_08400 [Methanosphaera sp. rholeuAM270]|nr:MAG: hypothetical protein BZ138_08400 [Methanosphaera sp. rholeuAM270]